jgi:hypothetical protein
VHPIHILLWWYGVCWEFMKHNEFLALWLEGLALVAIFIWDRKDAADQHKEMLEQQDIWRRQIHADRVAGIFDTMFHFADSMIDGVLENDFEPGDTYSWIDPDTGRENVMREYIALLKTRHIAVLINPALAEYVTARVAEANALSNCPDSDEFAKRFKVFREHWKGEKMAEEIRELS